MKKLTLALTILAAAAALTACANTTAPRRNGYAVAYDASTCSGYWVGTGAHDSTWVCAQ